MRDEDRPWWQRSKTWIVGALIVVAFGLMSNGVPRDLWPIGGFFGDSAFTIKVSGTRGLAFSGNYGVMTGSKSTNQRTVQGIVPASYQAQGSIVSAVFQKLSTGRGSLVVDISKDGRTVGHSATVAAYGAVSVASR